MQICTVLLKTETASDPRIEQARINHGLTGFDLILVGDEEGWVSELVRKGTIKSINRPYVIGEAVFTGTPSKVPHVGFICGFDYDGEPLVVEERGLDYGCVVTRMDKRSWTLRGLMTKKFAYDSIPAPKPTPTIPITPGKWTVSRVLKLTDPMQKGDDVKELQKRIYDFGIKSVVIGGKTKTLTADGTFGSITDAAVRLYQKANALDVDGKAGKNTIAKLGGTWGG